MINEIENIIINQNVEFDYNAEGYEVTVLETNENNITYIDISGKAVTNEFELSAGCAIVTY